MLDRDEAARRLHVSRRTIRRWAAAGLLDERRLSSRVVLVTEESVAALLRAGKDAAA